MKTKDWGSFGKFGGFAAAALMLGATSLAGASAPVHATRAAAVPVSVMSQVLNDIRAEQRRAMQQAARKALAGQRSETQAALSQGGTVSASTSVQAKR